MKTLILLTLCLFVSCSVKVNDNELVEESTEFSVIDCYQGGDLVFSDTIGSLIVNSEDWKSEEEERIGGVHCIVYEDAEWEQKY